MVRLGVCCASCHSVPVEPYSGESARLRARNVDPQAVAHMAHVGRADLQLLECDTEDTGIRFGYTDLTRDDHCAEKLFDAQSAQRITLRVGRAVGDDREPEVGPRQPRQ